MNKLFLIAIFVAVCSVLLLRWNPGTTHFAPGVCDRLEPFLRNHIVGQDLAISQLVDAVCSHVSSGRHSVKPLVISVHGPPGVGKTFTHTLLARALYNKQPELALDCPGVVCQGAKIIIGLDFTREEQQSQLVAVRRAILEHVRNVPDPLIVIEEYDKLDCATRAMLRQLIEHPRLLENATFSRAIVLLESNIGFARLEQMLSRASGDRSQMSQEAVGRALKDAVFELWSSMGCEEYLDTLKFASAIDIFLPYFPLQRKEVAQLMSHTLQRWAARFLRDKATKLQWSEDVVSFLTDKVDFDGPYPLEGAKQVESVATRYLARILRSCPTPPADHAAPADINLATNGTHLNAMTASGQDLLHL